MPTYDYQCINCGDKFEHFQTMTEQPLQICKKCGGQLKRLIGTGLGPIFKGSGFYQTDYKSASSTSTKGETNPAAVADSKKSEVKKSSEQKKPE